MKIIPCEQGSIDWWNARRGIPTASCFKRLITATKGELAKGRGSYIAELIGELAGYQDFVTTKDIQQGVELEPDARKLYEFESGCKVQEVGFCLHDSERFGCSPDGLIGDDGGLELKCPKAKTHVEYLLAGTLPADYRAQVHGSLLVTGRKWWDFMSYCRGLPPLRVRVVPDDYTEKLQKALEKFLEDYDAALAKVDRLGGIEVEPIQTEIVW